MELVIEGHHLPGLACEWDDRGELRSNVHVGLQVGREPTQLHPADRRRVRWTTEIDVIVDGDGSIDFRGGAVQGRRGDRFVYLTWGEPGDDGGFDMFRRAKLMLNRIDASLIRNWLDTSGALVASVHLTDELGMPRCARVDPPAVEWKVRA